jgi:tripartite-type tricarboxylate transporter receptor subunit TctC
MTLHRSVFQASLALALMTGVAPAPAHAQPAEEFFTNKRELIFITSSNVGGGYDSYSRLLSRHMTKYLPGNPRFVVQNMLGGGGVRATNFIYNVAPKDGSTIALVDRGMPTAPLLFGDRSQTKFEAQKFTWIGSLMRETGMGVIATRSKAKNIDDAKIHEIFFGATGPETDPAMYARLVNELLGTKIKVINGYKGQPDEFQAVERGELDGLFMSGWSGPGRAYVRDRIPRGELRLFLQMARARDPEHDDTPTLLELVKASIDRQIVEFQLDRVEVGRPVLGPPGIPQDRIAMLRTAFDKAVADPEFLKEAGLLKLAIDPMDGAAAQQVIDRLYRTPASVLERIRKVVQAAPE